jgi:Pyruvate/2-oxoacid:ferredoxin oxidoreductase delta subunit
LYFNGCRHLFVLAGNCAHCDRNTVAGPNLKKAATTLNRILQSRQLAPLALKFSHPSVWKRVYFKSKEKVDVRQTDRRRFFRQVITEAMQQRIEKDDAAKKKSTVVSRLPAFNPDTDLFPHVPRIDTTLCTGCNGCINTCPHDALSLVEESEEPHYAIDATGCTGCMICRDICSPQAIDIESCETVHQKTIPLQRLHCRSCGTDYYRPNTAGVTHDLCHICIDHNHQKQLYQVLE